MKNKICILGSTGSIGITTLNIIKRDFKNFDVVLLSTNSNGLKLFKQAKQFNVKNVIITNNHEYLLWKDKFLKNKIKIYNNFRNFKKLFKSKLDYSINAISGIDGLEPTLNIIKHTKKIAIANKESIICGWNLIKKELNKYKTKFIPVDSEHFSIFKIIKNVKNDQINKIIITASGGPFLKKKIHRQITIKDALKHPNWQMGKKISIDSATLMNKVFEVIEAKKIFNITLDKIDIIINPNSYIHASVIFNNGTIQMLAHETKMEIPILNSIYDKFYFKYKTKNIDINKINNLNFTKPNIKKFKTLKILKLVPNQDSLFETILISTNDELVKMFLNREIKFSELINYLTKIINFKIFKKYCKMKPSSINQILKTRDMAKNIVRLHIKKKLNV